LQNALDVLKNWSKKWLLKHNIHNWKVLSFIWEIHRQVKCLFH